MPASKLHKYLLASLSLPSSHTHSLCLVSQPRDLEMHPWELDGRIFSNTACPDSNYHLLAVSCSRLLVSVLQTLHMKVAAEEFLAPVDEFLNSELDCLVHTAGLAYTVYTAHLLLTVHRHRSSSPIRPYHLFFHSFLQCGNLQAPMTWSLIRSSDSYHTSQEITAPISRDHSHSHALIAKGTFHQCTYGKT